MAKKITTKETKEKKTTTTKKATTSKSKKSVKAELEKIEQITNQAEDANNIFDLVPDEVETENGYNGTPANDPIPVDTYVGGEHYVNPDPVDFDAEVKSIIEDATPSQDVVDYVEEFENEKEKLNEKINKNPEKAEETIKAEIKKIEAIRKKVADVHANLQKQNEKTIRRENFTNLWNGMGYDL